MDGRLALQLRPLRHSPLAFGPPPAEKELPGEPDNDRTEPAWTPLQTDPIVGTRLAPHRRRYPPRFVTRMSEEPMRRFLKIFVTVVILAGGFVAYLLHQPSGPQQGLSSGPPAIQPRQTNDGDLIVGKGEYAWVRQFDDQGKLSSRFRAQKWDPQKNGLVKVTRPEAELYVKGKGDARARISIQGTDGEVVTESLPEASQADSPLDPKNMSGTT